MGQDPVEQIRGFHNNALAAPAGMHADARMGQDLAVAGQMKLVIPIKDQAERIDGAGLHAQLFFQQLGRTEGQPGGAQCFGDLRCAEGFIADDEQQPELALVAVVQKEIAEKLCPQLFFDGRQVGHGVGHLVLEQAILDLQLVEHLKNHFVVKHLRVLLRSGSAIRRRRSVRRPPAPRCAGAPCPSGWK